MRQMKRGWAGLVHASPLFSPTAFIIKEKTNGKQSQGKYVHSSKKPTTGTAWIQDEPKLHETAKTKVNE